MGGCTIVSAGRAVPTGTCSRIPTRCINHSRSPVKSNKNAFDRRHIACQAVSANPSTLPNTKLQPDAYPSSASGQAASVIHGAAMCGLSTPLGAHFNHDLAAHNFALFSGTASSVTLVLFRQEDLFNGRTTAEIPLDPMYNRTGNIWHVAIPGISPDILYGYRVGGAHEGAGGQPGSISGLRHDATKVLLDPYATSVVSRARWGEAGNANLDYESDAVLGLSDTWPQAAAPVPDPSAVPFDWQGDRPLNIPMQDLVIYEAHVRGFTADPSSNVSAPGSYNGMTERLDYLQHLGITAVELLPVFEYNELEYYTPIPGTDLFRYNFWGYSTVAFFAPMARFSAEATARSAQNELKMLVREAHKRGIEVILDVVFNHTAEGNEQGPHISFRGVDNRTYYMLAPEGQYYNYSGCGNTFNCNNPVARVFILDCLRFWVQEYHIDGFRFDLASILTRAPAAWHPAEWAGVETDSPAAQPLPTELHSGGAVVCENGYMTDGSGVATGTPVEVPPCVEMISEDPILRSTKMIAEAWDCDGLNQVGAFPHFGGRWAEWNGQFRDTVRQFIKGTDGEFIGPFASAIMGSPELYGKSETHEGDWWGLNSGARWRGGRTPLHTINFVTAHDGFTLADLVSYSSKHNEANGEDNNDGETHNLCWNCGVEGPTEKAKINNLRQRQIRNHAAALLLSQGVPMILMGDEYGHTKDGNNNTYCHDSHWNYVNWKQATEDEHGLRRFWTHMIRLRQGRPEIGQSHYLSGEVNWHGEKRDTLPEWGTGRFIAMTLNGQEGNALYIAWNTKHEGVMAELPERPGRLWRALVDTGKPAPYDFISVDARLDAASADFALAQAAAWTMQGVYAMLPWSCVVLESVPEAEVQWALGEDRWDSMRRPSVPVQGAPGVPPPVEDAEVGAAVGSTGATSLRFGEVLQQQQQSSARPGPAPSSASQSQAAAARTLQYNAASSQRQDFGASAPPPIPPQAAPSTQPSATPQYDPPTPAPKQVSAQPQDTGPVSLASGLAADSELELLATELLGSASSLATMNAAEKAEMLQILRENLVLRKKLEGDR